ncbi:TRAFAC clade GTPase domain-containing protein [Sphaerisporangium corydalis]|uniref:Double-GTPase 2 domain-containing protein n=1 Tax=Sphaerisporangium corydalis TaxID=1441875 RepID=A0ABV9EQV1_9ACTN|nr:hypothetical protein [Sphaerisporangium corydalis]
MPFVAVFVIALWCVCMYFGFLYGFPVLCAITLVAATLIGVGHYFARAGRVLLPTTVGGASPSTPGTAEGNRDPAYRHYLFNQASQDWWRILRSVIPAIGQNAKATVSTVTRWLMSNVQGFFLLPVWLAVVAGLALATIPLAVAGAALTSAYALVVLAGMLVWLLLLALLLSVEQVFMRARRILQTCPHPQCYARIDLPEYACPACGERHRHLTPNLDGAFRHVCRCGTRLPTAIVLGRFRLQAYCPECGRALPHRIGRARIEPLPFVGGPDAGKTTFMVLAINALHGVVKAAKGRAGFVVQGDEMAFARFRQELRLGKVSKTTTSAPSATMVDITLPGSRTRSGNRILYLFDPSGEGFTGSTQVEAMSYLAHGEAMLIVVDPFALPLVQQNLSAAERQTLDRAGVVLSPEDPSDTFQRVRNELAARADGGRQKRVAVVVTKADLLRRTSVGRDAERLPGWFDQVGLGNMIRDLAKTAGEVRYLASGLPADEAAIGRLLAWLTDLPVPAPPTPNGSTPANPNGGSAPTDHDQTPTAKRSDTKASPSDTTAKPSDATGNPGDPQWRSADTQDNPDAARRTPDSTRQTPNDAQENPNSTHDKPNSPQEDPNNSRDKSNDARENPNNANEKPDNTRDKSNSAPKSPNNASESPNDARERPDNARERPDDARERPDDARERSDHARDRSNDGTAGGSDEADLTTADLRRPWAPRGGDTSHVPLNYRLFRWSLFGTSALVGAAVMILLALRALPLLNLALPG